MDRLATMLTAPIRASVTREPSRDAALGRRGGQRSGTTQIGDVQARSWIAFGIAASSQ